MYKFQLRFHKSLSPRVQLTIFQHWFRWWFDTNQAISHYLNQWCLGYWRIYAPLSLNELKPFLCHHLLSTFTFTTFIHCCLCLKPMILDQWYWPLLLESRRLAIAWWISIQIHFTAFKILILESTLVAIAVSGWTKPYNTVGLLVNHINSLTSGRRDDNFKSVFSEHKLS